jgi:type II secretory pathway component HofQ
MSIILELAFKTEGERMKKICIVTSLALTLIAQISIAAPETQTREFRLEYSEAAVVATAIQTLFKRTHPLLNIEANEKRNSLTVTGSADDIKEIDDLIKQTDVMAQQVLVEAVVVETDHSGHDEILSTPVLLTINGQQAALSSSDKRPILVQGKEQIPPQFAVSSGMSLLITPYILGSEIFLEGELELSSGPEQAAVKNGKGESVLIDSKRIVFSTQIENADEPYVIGPVRTESGKSITIDIKAHIIAYPKKLTGVEDKWIKTIKANK